MQQNVHVCMFLGIPPIPNRQPNYDKFLQRSFGKTNSVKRSFQDSWFTNIRHGCITMKQMISRFVWFCMVAYKDVKLTVITLTKHLSSMNFRTRRMLVLPSRNTILQSAMIGIAKNFCLFGLRLYVPVNNFSVMSGRSHRFLGITSTFLGGIDKNKQCDYLTCIQRKNRRSRLEGSKLLYNL